jgi:hypothetical protein
LTRESEVQSLTEFQRLLAVTSSPIFGPSKREFLLPRGHDPLTEALDTTPEWAVAHLTTKAAQIARETDDYSLVGLAARVEDPVVLTALRESVVLYEEAVTLCARAVTWPKYVWRVDDELSAAAQRFVDTFNALFGRELPPPRAEYAHAFAGGFDESHIVGRCVRLGQTDEQSPRYYHWAITTGSMHRQLAVVEFWASDMWTTERYRSSRHVVGR